jgi:hypothetical protein
MEASLGQATAVLDNRWNNRRKVARGGLVDFSTVTNRRYVRLFFTFF